MFVNDMETFSWLLTTMVLGELVVPTSCPPKIRALGLKLTGARPEPVRLAVCGLLLALSLTLNVAVWLPVVVGANVTVMVQKLFAGMLVPQVLTWVYAADPVIDTLIFVNATL